MKLNYGLLFLTLLLSSHISLGDKSENSLSSDSVCTREDGGICSDRVKPIGNEKESIKVVANGVFLASEISKSGDKVYKTRTCQTSPSYTKNVPSGYNTCGDRGGSFSSDGTSYSYSTQYCLRNIVAGKITQKVSAPQTCTIDTAYITIRTDSISVYIKYCCDSSNPSPTPTLPPPPSGSSTPPSTIPPSSPPGGASSEINAWLKPHNDARKSLGINPLVWDEAIAATALSWAKNLASRGCIMEHGGHDGMGQNLAWWSGGNPTTQSAVGLWVNEKKDYTYGKFPNNCRSGAVCGHYTQVIWKKTKKVGCARVKCPNGGIEFVCNYSPPGNYIGQFPY